MTEHDDGPRPHHPGRELQAADDIGVDEVAGDAGGENVADLLVEYEFGRHAAVDTADNGGKRSLTLGGRADLSHQVAIDALARDEAFVAFLEHAHCILQEKRLLAVLGENRALIGVPNFFVEGNEGRAAAPQQSERREIMVVPC